jgi:hypothetical protein
MNKPRMLSLRTRPAQVALAALVAAGLTMWILTFGQSSATATSEKTVSVPGNVEWTDTGIALAEGQKVTIKGEGKINPNAGSGEVTPVGATFPQKRCGVDQYSFTGFPAPGVNCWSMLFRIGKTGVPFLAGSKITFVSPVAGELELGVNDNFLSDNSGAWTAKITY